MQTHSQVNFFTPRNAQALRAFARLVEELPRNNTELNGIVDEAEQLTKWLWRKPRLIKCADIADRGKVWLPLEAELKVLVSKIELIGDQLEPLGIALLATFEQALAQEADGDGRLPAVERQVWAGAAQRVALFEAHAKRAVVVANGVRDKAYWFAYNLRTQALPSLRKLSAAATVDSDQVWFPTKSFEEFRALLWRLLLDDAAEVGASALLDVCALLHDYIQTAAERLAAIQEKAQLLEFILCLEEVLNLWREVRRHASHTLAALQ